jgi:hypothetical protein
MRANLTAFLPAVGFFGRLPAFNLGSGIPSEERLSHKKEAPAAAEIRGLDAYMVAVLLLIGAAILSL